MVNNMGFMDKDFLLESKSSKALYNDHAQKMPVIDYHCHLDPSEIYLNKHFDDLAEAWLGGDHYKWRLMRANGVNEDRITGNASGWEKFRAFAEVIPQAIGNPIYHWVHLELRRYFECNKILCPESAKDIWDFCNNKLNSSDELNVRGILKMSGVEVLITTDDPVDDLRWHKNIADDNSISVKVLPGWRPELALNIEYPEFYKYIQKLGDITDTAIKSYSDMKTALLKRLEFFNVNGCIASDHGIGKIIYAPATDNQLNQIFTKAQNAEVLTEAEANQYRYDLLLFCAKEYSRLGWVMQLHLGAMRDNNTAMFQKIGPNTGFDCSNLSSGMAGLSKFLDTLELSNTLPKTILFSIDPADFMTLSTLAACYMQTNVKGKVQQGTAWWFNDTLSGMQNQLVCLAEQGLLGNFIGMLTDSRSFLSYTRHEYFRRILCRLIGKWVDNGLYPNNSNDLGRIVEDICYNNVKNYFGL